MADEITKTTPEIVFNANVSAIVKFEKETGKSIMRAFGQEMSITTIVTLVKCMSNADDDMINAYVKEHGFEGLVDATVKALENSGFLREAKGKAKA